MKTDLLKIYSKQPDERVIRRIVDILKAGGIIVYPTDTVYSFGCDIHQQKAIEKIARIKSLDVKKHHFTFVFDSISSSSAYTKTISNKIFKLLKKNTPGPFTFLLNANNTVPHLLKGKKKTIGIRIPNHIIPQKIVQHLASPIISTSVYDEDEMIEYTTNPELIAEKYDGLVDAVVDGGIGNLYASTIVDCLQDDFQIIRQGLGDLEI